MLPNELTGNQDIFEIALFCRVEPSIKYASPQPKACYSSHYEEFIQLLAYIGIIHSLFIHQLLGTYSILEVWLVLGCRWI